MQIDNLIVKSTDGEPTWASEVACSLCPSCCKSREPGVVCPVMIFIFSHGTTHSMTVGCDVVIPKIKFVCVSKTGITPEAIKVNDIQESHSEIQNRCILYGGIVVLDECRVMALPKAHFPRKLPVALPANWKGRASTRTTRLTSST